MITECPSCGAGEDELCDEGGRNVCTSCGVILPGGSRITHTVAYSEAENYTPKQASGVDVGCPLIKCLKNRHPGCVTSALNLLGGRVTSLSAGIHSAEMPRYAQALAYIAYKVDGHQVKISDLAGQINVPVERMRKDVNRLSQRLGIASTCPVTGNADDDADDDVDLVAFKRALIDLIRPWHVATASDTRAINGWCTALFSKATGAGDTTIVNAPPRNVAIAALSLYCRQDHSVFGGLKRKRGADDVCELVTKLARHSSVRKLVASLRVNINDDCVCAKP